MFALYDAGGALLWAAAFVLLGYFLGARAAQVLERYGTIALVIGGVIALAGVGFIVYRLWKRRRHGPASFRVRAPRAAPTTR